MSDNCPIDQTPTRIVDGAEICERGHRGAPRRGEFTLTPPRVLFVIVGHRTVMHGDKTICRASSEQWAKRIKNALNHEQERKHAE